MTYQELCHMFKDVKWLTVEVFLLTLVTKFPAVLLSSIWQTILFFLPLMIRGGPGIPGAINNTKNGGPFLHCKNISTSKVKINQNQNAGSMIILSFCYYISSKYFKIQFYKLKKKKMRLLKVGALGLGFTALCPRTPLLMISRTKTPKL